MHVKHRTTSSVVEQAHNTQVRFLGRPSIKNFNYPRVGSFRCLSGQMSDRAYGYYQLELFGGQLVLPLKFSTSYPSEDSMRSKLPTRTGVDGVPTSRIFVLPKKGCSKVEDVEDIDRVLPWGSWETYLNTGSVANPELVSLDKFEGVAELLEQDKDRSKERNIVTSGIIPMSKLKPRNYNGRNFHTYPQSDKDKTNEKWHNIYRLLALYLKLHNSFVLCTFFAKGEELGCLHEDGGILRMAGLYADVDLKPVSPIVEFPITRGLQRLVYEKLDKLKSEQKPVLVLEWTTFVRETLENKGVRTARCALPKKRVVNEEQTDKDLKALFEGL